MTDVNTLSTDHSRAVADGAHSHGTVKPRGSRADRLTSFDLADFELPNGREEDWRFTPVKRLAGRFSEKYDDVEPINLEVGAPEGVTVSVVEAGSDLLGRTAKPGDRSAATAWTNAGEATVVTLAKDTKLEAPVRIDITGAGHDNAVASHLLVEAEQFAEGTVVIDHTGQGVLNQTVEVVAQDGAQLTVISIQDWDAGAVHASSQRIQVGRDATVRHIVVTLGGELVRITPEARFAGEGGNIEMFGLYFTDAGQHQEHRLFVDHNLPNCRSRVTYKGALNGEDAHAVWVGDVLIRVAAEGTDTYELNRNLVLSEGARADSVPNLEIETGLIEGAGHASATGRFDDLQLFYLRSRGIPEADARRLVVHGFFAELITEIGVPEVEERLIAAIEEELATSMSKLGAADTLGLAEADRAAAAEGDL